MATLSSTIYLQDRVRPCVAGKRKALFHRWADKYDSQKHQVVGIVEYNDGTVHETYPNEIRFTDDWVETIHGLL